MKKLIIVVFSVFVCLSACEKSRVEDLTPENGRQELPKQQENNESAVNKTKALSTSPVELINLEGNTIYERFCTPAGFERIEAESGSFGEYLRTLKLKPHDSPVKYYNGNIKVKKVHEAVIDMDVGERDLQQCADAVMRLWAEYLYLKGQYEKIHFNFTNGFKADYTNWRKGNRINVQSNTVKWVAGSTPSDDYGSFRKYMDMVFSYAGTLSLSKEMVKVELNDMRIGDVFIKGGSPGHCVIVVDMAQDTSTGDRLFMVAQSYMPAQDIHILKNRNDEDLSPWYDINFGETLYTPEWTFDRDQLMRFDN